MEVYNRKNARTDQTLTLNLGWIT